MPLSSGQLYGDNLKNIIEMLTDYTVNKKLFVICTSNMEQTCATEEELQEAMKEASNWKAPGRDLIQNWWCKKLTVIHKTLATCINKLLQHPEDTQEILTKGNICLIPKDNNTSNPLKYRPITCLVTLCKLTTAIITR
jgi:hypothetical protein